MSGLLLAVRGLWWRRGLSAAVLAVAALVVAIAVAGPTYDRAAKESVLQDALRTAPTSETGLEVSGSSTVAGLLAPVQEALATAGTDPYDPPITALEAAYDGNLGCSRSTSLPTSGCNAPVSGLVVARDQAFAHLRLVAGRLPSRSGEVLASTVFLQLNALRVGDRIDPSASGPHVNRFAPPPPPPPSFSALTIVGSWTTDQQDPTWFDRPYFVSRAPGAAGADGDSYQDALFTVPATVAGLSASAVVDLPLAVHRVRVADAARVTRAVRTVEEGAGTTTSDGAGNFLVVSTELPSVLRAAAADEHALGTPILLIVLQLVLLCGLVLIGAVRSAAEARGPEVALATLRRFRRRDVVMFGLAEPLLLVPLSLPVGLLLGWLATRALAGGQLVSGTPVVLPLVGLWAALAAVAAAALTSAVIGLRILLRPPSAQWRRATQRAAARPWWIDLLVVGAAVGGVAWLLATGGLSATRGQQGSTASPYSLLAPALLSIAVAMLGSRALPALCRAAYGWTRRRGVGGFLAVRQVARRPTTLTATVLLTVALTLATFAVSAAAVAAGNRHAVAETTVGAATVVSVQVPPGVNLAAAVDRADPGGRHAMAVTEITAQTADHRELIGVQPERLAAVGYWRSDFAGGRSLASVARRLEVPGLHPVTLTGSQVRVTAATTGLRGAAVIRLTVTLVSQVDGTSTLTSAPLPGTGVVAAVLTLPSCSLGCRLTGLGVQRDELGVTDLVGDVRFSAVAQRTTGGPWRPVPDAFTGGAAAWRAPTADAGYRADVTTAGSGLDFAFDLPWQERPQISPYDLPATVPAAVSFPVSGPGATTVGGLDQQSLPITPVTIARALPRAAADGALVDRTLALRAAGNTTQAQNEVWLAAGADPAVLHRIAAAGVQLGGRQTVAGTAAALSRQGPPLALALFRVGAVVAAILALLGTALVLALAGRRRAFELSALHVLGLRQRALWRSLAAEQAALLGFGALLGVATGLVGALVSLRSVPEFVVPPLAPPLRFTPPYPLVTGIAVALTAVVLAGALVGSALLVRSVRPDRLREYVP